jgi:hypothetical protein
MAYFLALKLDDEQSHDGVWLTWPGDQAKENAFVKESRPGGRLWKPGQR